MTRLQFLAISLLLLTYAGLCVWFFRTIVIITPDDYKDAESADPRRSSAYDHESSWH